MRYLSGSSSYSLPAKAALSAPQLWQYIFWFLLFIALPLAFLPRALLELLPSRFLSFSPDGLPEVLLPKIVLLVVLWFIGVGLLVKTGLKAFRARLAAEPAVKVPLRWLCAFLAALLFTSFFHESNLGFSLHSLLSRFQNPLAILLEVVFYSLAAISCGLVCARLLPSAVPFSLLAWGAACVSLWTLLQVYGFDLLLVFDPQAEVRSNMAATMRHYGFLAAYLGVALVSWLAWKILSKRLAPFDLALAAILTAGLVASGGRAGIIAALFTLALLLASALLSSAHRRQRPLLLALGAVILVVATTVALSSGYAQARLDRLHLTVQGADPAVNHRSHYWRIAAQAVRDRPLVGHGSGAFSYLVWQYATPEQADALLAEFLPPDIAENAYRIGGYAVFRHPDTGRLTITPMRSFKVHNYFLDIALASGLPALLLFIGFVVSVAKNLHRARTAVALAALLGLVTYLLYGMLWFSTPEVDPVVWGLVGVGMGSMLLGDEAQ